MSTGYAIKAMTSSSSTESGCDGSVDDKTDDESSIDNLQEDSIEENKNKGNKVKNMELHDDTKEGLINNDSMKHNSSQLTDSSVVGKGSKMSAKGELKCFTASEMPDYDDQLIESIDNEMDRTQNKKGALTNQNFDGETQNLIDDVLKEFENPTSIYISDNERNGRKNDAIFSESEASSKNDNSILGPRRASGVKASQIIKENSEMLEKIMRKRVDSMTGISNEQQVRLDKEEIIENESNHSRDVNISGKNDNSCKQMSHSNSLNQNEINHNMSKNSTVQRKKESFTGNNGSKHFPAVATIEPVKPQLSKPQLNQTGGIVVQQRSDGRLGGQNSTKPITFNPFPNSSRIGQRKSNEVGRKLGLYPSTKN